MFLIVFHPYSSLQVYGTKCVGIFGLPNADPNNRWNEGCAQTPCIPVCGKLVWQTQKNGDRYVATLSLSCLITARKTCRSVRQGVSYKSRRMANKATSRAVHFWESVVVAAITCVPQVLE